MKKYLVISMLTALLGVYTNCSDQIAFKDIGTDDIVSKIDDGSISNGDINESDDSTSNDDSSSNSSTSSTDDSSSSSSSSSSDDGAASGNDDDASAASNADSDDGESNSEDGDVSEEDSSADASYNCQTDGDNGNKVLICHVPPGNPAARHEICISRNALQAHVSNHEDYLGYCNGNTL